MSTILRGIGEEFPYLIHKGIIYQLAYGFETDIFWDNEFSKICFIESEDLNHLEELILQPILKKEIEKKEVEFNKKLEESIQRNNQNFHYGLDNKITELGIKFLANGRPGSEKQIIKEMFGSEENFSYVNFNKELILNSKRNCLLSDAIDSKSIFIIGDQYYELLNSSEDLGFGKISIGRKKFSISHKGNLTKIISDYDKFCKSKINDIVNKESKSHEVNSPNLNIQLKSIYDVGEINKRQIIKKGNKTYFCSIVDSFIVEAEGYKYKHPSCKAGFRVEYSNNSFNYYYPVRIIESKTMEKGIEKGSFKDLFDKDYPHFAVTTNGQDYPKLCINAGNYQDGSFNSNNINDFLDRLDQLSSKTIVSMENGYYKNDGRTNTVYRYFKNEYSSFLEEMNKNYKVN